MEISLQKGNREPRLPLRSLSLTETVNVVSIERDGRINIPRGHSVFPAGDAVTVFSGKEAMGQMRKIFTAPSSPGQE